jgi:hypothetical protein
MRILDAGEPAADHDEGQRPLADLLVVGGGGDVELRQDVVAQVDGLADGLEADAVLGQARDREGARDGARGHHEVVVGDPLRGAGDRLDDRPALGVGQLGHPRGHDVDLRQDPAQRNHDVAGREVARRGLGEEGLVGHVRLRVDDRDLDIAALQFALQLLLKAERGVEAHVAAADDEDVRGVGVRDRPSGHLRAPRVTL